MAIHTKVTTKYFDDSGHEFSREPIEETLNIKKVGEGFEARYLTNDEYPEGPDKWDNDDLFLVHYHRDFQVEKEKIIQEEEVASLYNGEKISQEKEYRIFPVKAYIHSGVSLSLGTGGFGHDPGGWDTSHVGACLAKRKDFPTREKAEKACESLVEEWNQYLSGDVYCLVKDTLDNKKSLVDTDSVCGYYGLKYAKEELNGNW